MREKSISSRANTKALIELFMFHYFFCLLFYNSNRDCILIHCVCNFYFFCVVFFTKNRSVLKAATKKKSIFFCFQMIPYASDPGFVSFLFKLFCCFFSRIARLIYNCCVVLFFVKKTLCNCRN